MYFLEPDSNAEVVGFSYDNFDIEDGQIFYDFLLKEDVYTKVETNFELIIVATNVEAVALLGLEASEVECKIINPYTNDMVYTNTLKPFKSYVKNYSDYVANRIEFKEEVLFTFGYQKKVYIELKIHRNGAFAKCGKILCGRFKNFGIAFEGVKVTIEDFSKYERADDGTLSINLGKSVRNMSASCWVENENVSMFLSRINSIRGKLGLFCVGEIMVYGYGKTNGVLCKRESKMLLDMEVEGAV